MLLKLIEFCRKFSGRVVYLGPKNYSKILSENFNWPINEINHNGASVKLDSIDLTHLVALEQFQQKPTGVYNGGLLQLALGEK